MQVFKKIKKKIAVFEPTVKVTLERNCIVLRGELDSWDRIVECGTLAVNKKYLGVINDIRLKGHEEKIYEPPIPDKKYDGRTPDIMIIGAGVTGAAIARELSKYDLDVMLLEKEYDVALAASSRNDGDVHVGIDLHGNQLKHKYNNEGNKLYDDICRDLGVTLHRTGHTIVLYKKWERFFVYPLIKLQSKLLGIPGLRLITGDEMKKYETGTPSWAKGLIFMPTGAEVSPYKLTVALAENAAQNGVEVCLSTIVKSMKVDNGIINAVETNRGVIYPKLVINAAGVFSDVIAQMAGDRTFTIHPRKGTNLILDKKCRRYATTSMTKSPFSKFESDKKKVEDLKHHTKGGGVCHTVDNNILVGPTATETPFREDTTTDRGDVDSIFKKLKRVAEKMSYGDIITYFSGIRAATYEEDFVVRKGIFTENILEASGIQSPGLTAAPAIAVDIAKWAEGYLGEFKPKKNFNPKRKITPHLAELSPDERNEYIKKNPDYGEIVCRCEEISKGEIIDAINSPIPVYTVDAIKRRVRPGMGRCQGGFCSPLVTKILAEYCGVRAENIKKSDASATVLFGDTKEEK